MTLKRKGNPNAGRKKEPDPKEHITLMVRRSSIVGKDNIATPIKDESGQWTKEYIEAKTNLMNQLYETIEFLKP